jgi:enoyl-CoA hydratase/carnithine racemase
MTDTRETAPVLIRRTRQTMSIVLNRPEAVNSLDLRMVRLIAKALDEAEGDPLVHRVLFYGKGERGFCAGGDVKAMARMVGEGRMEECLRFLQEEYRVDLAVHRFPKPVTVIADGITMGGGLGLCSGADIVLATERSRSAMPETRIGFFPDVGATGWLFSKCPPGYPEYLGIIGHEVAGPECVRVGLATHLISSEDLDGTIEAIENGVLKPSAERSIAAESVLECIDPFLRKEIPSDPAMDEWVKTYFAGRTSVAGIAEDLRECTVLTDLCGEVFAQLSQRSPTAVALTLQLLRRNEGRAIEDVLEADLRAARFILSHPDFLEGVRARLIDKDDRPRWRPARTEEVTLDPDIFR